MDLWSVDPSALFGVGDEAYDFPGYVIYDEREVAVPLLESSNTTTTTDPEPPASGPGW